MSNSKIDDIEKWINLTDSQLDKKLTDFISDCNSDFAYAYTNILHRMLINDEKLVTRIRSSFIRKAGEYSDERTKTILRKWEVMQDDDIAQSIVDIYQNLGKEALDRIYIFIDNTETKTRIDKIINGLVPKFRGIKVSNMLESWEKLSDEELTQKVVTEILGTGWTSSSSHWVFVNDIYPKLDDLGLKSRVDRILLALSDLSNREEESLEVVGRAIYVCAKLGLEGIRDNIIKAIMTVKDPSEEALSSLVQWLNTVLQEISVPEAEEYLRRQLDALPKGWAKLLASPTLPHTTVQKYVEFSRAYYALRLFNEGLAEEYKTKLA